MCVNHLIFFIMKIWSSVLIVLIVASLGYLIVTRASPALPQEEITTTTNTTQQETPMNTQEGQMDIKIIQEGTGEPIKVGQTAVMNYTGRLEDGTAFDSNVEAQFSHVEPFEFTLGQNRVIQGWEKGVLGMKVGEKRVLTIPSSLGYGASGIPGVIPANATLIFDVELVSIK